jgi:hypothetical protein
MTRILTILIAAALGLAAGCDAIGDGLTQAVPPEVYETAQKYVRGNATVRAELGDVRSFSPTPTDVKLDPIDQTATLDFAVSGSKGDGTIHLEVARDGEQWAVRSAEMTGPSGKRVPLKEAPPRK